MNKAAVSVVIIAKNEERRLEDCLKSAAWAKEIVVLDDQSTDRTVEIAKKYTDKIFQRAMDIEGRHRNFAYGKATQPWVLSLDADERVTPELAAEIAAVTAQEKNPHVCYAIPIKTFIGSRWIKGAGYYPAAKARLFRRGEFRYEEAGVHPRVIYQGSCGFLKGDILHYSCKNLEQWIGKFNRETTLEAQKWITDGRKVTLAKQLRKTADRFLKNYFMKKGIQDGFWGFLMSVFHGLYQLFAYAKYREMKDEQSKTKIDKLVFVDRDGVINVDPIGDYIKRWEDFRFEEGVFETLKGLCDRGYELVVISNQAGIGDGVYPESALWDIQKKMLAEFTQRGVRIRSSHYCLHGKKAGCSCSKPETGLFKQAVDGVTYDPGQTY
ncbi:MAG: HAD-IIIA family hydrolase, partial [Candidatus Omnitrophica bacterium]|nr:HAD-IIIA family hydrolase [Candidatus Omnitrophota bacterium]